MPTYQYHCADCGRDLEIFQKFSDDALTKCPECDGKLKKVFSPAGIVFKGSGFYVTDSGKRATPASEKPTNSDSASSGNSTTSSDAGASSASSAGTNSTESSSAN